MMQYNKKIIELYDRYIVARDDLHFDPYMNTKPQKALNTRRFNRLYEACKAEGLDPIIVICNLNEERRDKSTIVVEL